MSLYLDGIVDPIAALDDGRQVKNLPIHFITIQLSNSWNSDKHRNWIWKHFSGRFYIGEKISYNKNTKSFDTSFVVGFEDQGEATLFKLMSADSIVPEDYI